MSKGTTHAVLLLQPINKSTVILFFGLLVKHRCCFGAFLPVTSYKSRKTWDQRLVCQTAMSLTVHSEQPSMTPTHFPVFGFASSLFSSVPSLNSEEANTFVGGVGGVIIGWTVCVDHYTLSDRRSGASWNNRGPTKTPILANDVI